MKDPFQVAWHEWDTAENVFYRADIKCWERDPMQTRQTNSSLEYEIEIGEADSEIQGSVT